MINWVIVAEEKEEGEEESGGDANIVDQKMAIGVVAEHVSEIKHIL